MEFKESDTQKALYIDGVCQGVVSKDGTPLSPYMKPIMERMAGLQTGSDILFLGGGLYALPKWAQDRHHSVCVVELYDEVIKAHEATEGHCNSIHGDALTVIDELEKDWFDFILLDVFPNHNKLYCADYFVKCKQHLKKEGVFSMNYICNSKVEIDAMGKLLAAVWPNVKMSTFYSDKEMKNPCQVVYFANN